MKDQAEKDNRTNIHAKFDSLKLSPIVSGYFEQGGWRHTEIVEPDFNLFRRPSVAEVSRAAASLNIDKEPEQEASANPKYRIAEQGWTVLGGWRHDWNPYRAATPTSELNAIAANDNNPQNYQPAA